MTRRGVSDEVWVFQEPIHRIKQRRGIATPTDEFARYCRAKIILAAPVIWLRTISL